MAKSMAKNTPRSIGVYGPSWEDTFQRCVEGVLRYCDETGGTLLVRDFQSADMVEDFARPPVWTGRVDAMLVSIGREGPAHELADWLLTAGVPTVSVTADWFDPRVPACIADADSMAKLAARHLIQCRCDSFLFVGFGLSTGSAARGRALRDALASGGRELTEYESSVRMVGPLEEELPKFADPKLVKLLHRLPKPLGVWALNDNFAAGVSLLCEQQGLAVPEAVKILGVGDTRVARLRRPTLSSIRSPSDEVGYQSARTLHAMLDGQPGVRKVTKVRVTELAARESSVASAQRAWDLDRVREYINRHACNGVSVDQLVDIAGVSRRSFELWFRREVGRSPGEEIHRVRLERAKHLLQSTELSTGQIARMVGYEETAGFSRFFRAATGMTATDYRKGRS
jgi:LacI family transcriptional regulator